MSRTAPIRFRSAIRRGTTLLAAVLALGGYAIAAPGAASADSIGKYIALTGVVMDDSTPHTWSSSSVHLVWQTDANLVLYCNNTGKAIWASGTNYGTPVHQIDFGDGGNSGIAPGPITIFDYELGPALYGWQPVWETDGAPGDYAYVQNDGNFVVYASNGKALWATGTNGRC